MSLFDDRAVPDTPHVAVSADGRVAYLLLLSLRSYLLSWRIWEGGNYCQDAPIRDRGASSSDRDASVRDTPRFGPLECSGTGRVIGVANCATRRDGF